MLSIFDGLRDLTMLSVSVRMLLAVICGGIIGIEREYKRRPAGFRTHILICLGAAMTTLTSQYFYLCLEQYTDMARLGAQVVAGIGFIGAGTIIVTRRQRVKGLTTAAGLWAAAIIGLTLGGGFYEGGLFATILILVAELVFSRLEYRVLRNAPEINLYIEYTGSDSLETLLRLLRELELKILNMGIIHSKSDDDHNACAILNLRLPRGAEADDVMNRILSSRGVVSIREL
ncbi:MAG: MgtC/SapB family protein [Oscillibacter sp.]|jgi:putative Mg2+ transporter-C (MgtC) family protein|nr:MgtC/SapB family protein [Oscillibacter sp.]